MTQPVIVNNPSGTSDNGMGFLLGVILILFVGGLLVYYGLPYFQQTMNKGVQINMPKTVDVKVQQTK